MSRIPAQMLAQAILELADWNVQHLLLDLARRELEKSGIQKVRLPNLQQPMRQGLKSPFSASKSSGWF